MLCFALAFAFHFDAPALAEDAPETVAQIEDRDVLGYLDQVIDWQRAVTGPTLAMDNARESLLKDATSDTAKIVIKSAFAFARAEAAAMRSASAARNENALESDDRRVRIQKRAEETDRQIKSLQMQLSVARPKGMTAHMAQLHREQLTGQLKLLNAQKNLLQTLLGIFGASESTEGTDVLSKVNSLSRTLLIESERGSPAKAVDTAKSETTPDTSISEGEGIFGIASALFANTRKRQDLDHLLAQTRDLHESNTALITNLRGALQAALAEGNRLGQVTLSGDAKQFADHRRNMDALLWHYRQLADAVVPLGQIGYQLESATRGLKEWRDLIGQDWEKLFQRLLFRLGLLGICILIPLLISDIARRTAHRYVQDARRQRQLRIFRRVVLGTVLVIAIILNFVTEFTSLATFAGFLTAGLAVALQTVLVSLTAHFFFFGRFGVRVGDRVTVSGVTGDVVQLGMLRLYLMELKGEEGEMRPTGKIVAFPNSVLFNPTAFYKQVSGTSYGWKELVFQLDPEIDYTAAKNLARAAVDEVYGEYKEALELQQSVLEQSTRLSVKVPAPREEMRITSAGMAYVVNYPVVLKRAHEIQERITDKLMESFRRDPSLRLVLSNPLRIEAIKVDA